MADTNPFIESFLQGLREQSAQQMEAKRLAQQESQFGRSLSSHEDQFGRTLSNKEKEDAFSQALKQALIPIEYPGLEPVEKPGVSGGQPFSAPSQGTPGVPQVGPLGRIQPEPQLVNPPTTGFDVSSTTKPNTSGPPTQADSLNPFAAAMQALMGPQSQAGPPVGADTLGQITPGNRVMPTQAGAANEMVGQGAGQGGGGGAISPAGRIITLPNGQSYRVPPPAATTFDINVPADAEAAKWLGTGKQPVPLSVMPTIATMIRDAAKPDQEKGVPLPTDIARSIDPTGGLDGLKVPFKDIISLINGKPGKDNILQVIEERYNPKVSPARAKELDAVITRYQHITQPVNFGTIGDPNSMGSKMVRKTSSGNEYVNGAGLSKKDFGEATKQLGIKQGIPVFDKDQVNKLKEIETSRDGIADMWNQIKMKLPRDAQGRITAGPNNMIKAYMQSDAVLGAWKSWNDVHLRNMQNLSETKGIRNMKHINIAIEDNAFGPTDTIGVAAQKANNLLKQYDNIEKEFFRAYTPE